jgi:hypothetical protein
MKPKKEPVNIREDELIRRGRDSEDKPSPYGKGASKHQGNPEETRKSSQIHIETEEEIEWPPPGTKPKI